MLGDDGDAALTDIVAVLRIRHKAFQCREQIRAIRDFAKGIGTAQYLHDSGKVFRVRSNDDRLAEGDRLNHVLPADVRGEALADKHDIRRRMECEEFARGVGEVDG